mgnify:CR=1 FL=1|jgi:hypothetical protein
MKNKVISNLLVAVAKGLEAIRQIVRAISRNKKEKSA